MFKFSQRDVDPETFIQNLKREYPDCNIALFYRASSNSMNLTVIQIPPKRQKQGLGTAIMNKIADYARANGISVTLSPSTDFGASSIDRLKRFYKGFGFVENKGRNKDFTHRETMHLKP